MRARELLRGLSGRRVPQSLVFSVVLATSACQTEQSSDHSNYYDRKIGPVLVQSCAASPTKSGCHVAADDRGNALGNLNVTSYDSLTKRKDLFLRYGPYGLPALLLKVAPPFPIALTTWQSATPTLVTTNIAHVGGSLLDLTTPSFTLLNTWISNGFAVNNAPAQDPTFVQTACSNSLGSDPNFDSTTDPSTPDFSLFASTVNPVIGTRCAAGNCHGSSANPLYLTCGTSPEALRWNYFAIGDYVSTDTGSSEILQRALSPSAGGVYHEGGTVFQTTDDPGYQALKAWATLKGGPTDTVVPGRDDGLLFFADRVQPMLVKRGCMMLNCHSGTMGHDYRLSGGSGGHFGLPATRENYDLTLEELALESPDFNASRLVRKNLPPDAGGLRHRGGPLFADQFECTDAELAAAADPTVNVDTQPMYCVIKAWYQKERAARFATPPALTGIVFVRRPPAPLPDRPQDYDVYAPGAKLIEAAASLNTENAVTVGAETDLTALCGLSASSTDARRAAVSWDGQQIAFSARESQTDPFHIYVVNAGKCSLQPDIDKPAVADDGSTVPTNGELIHNFDPTFAPDGRIVFASTRGNIMNTGAFSYSGPQRTPADPSKLNANLYVLEGSTIRQLTFLLNQELSPSFMRDGRLILVTEKRAPGFYQLAGRRMNLDGGDYHPLFGQRDTIGFDQLTDLVELSDKNFAAILSEQGAAHGAGTLAIINRSVGIDQSSEDLDDYTMTQAVPTTEATPTQVPATQWPTSQFYMHSMSIVDPAATGQVDGGTQGAYRSPSPLPSQHLLVSYAANVVDLSKFSGNFDIVELDPSTGARTPLISGPDDELWPVAVSPRYNLRIFQSKLDEPNGATQVLTDDAHKDHAEITFLDAPLLATLLFQNTRTGRPVPTSDFGLSLWEDFPPDAGVTSFDAADPSLVFSDDYGKVFVKRGLLGAPPLYTDSSASVSIRGGMPLVLRAHMKLATDSSATEHFQREEMQFYPGEVVRQGFRRSLFNGVCAGCHGAVSGYDSDIAANPDILTQASRVEAKLHSPSDFTLTPIQTTGPVAP